MTTIVQVKEAIAALKDRTGSSVVAISKWLDSEKKVSVLAIFFA
jgi:linker histone H1 and H5 family